MSHFWHALRQGNWRSLLACFLYFDTGFTLWVMLGPLAPFMAPGLHVGAADLGFLVAVPVLSAAILRIMLGALYQSWDGRSIALLGVALSALPVAIIGCAGAPGFHELVILGVLLGFGGASFAVALPMAGSSYPAKVQGLVLGLAAAGNVGAVLDGFLFPALAQSWGWQRATLVVLPLLAVTAWALYAFADDRQAKQGSVWHGLRNLLLVTLALLALIEAVHAGILSTFGRLLLPVLGVTLALAVLPGDYRRELKARDAWLIMLIYSITFGGFVGMSSYVAVLMSTAYHLSKVHAGMVMAVLACTGALLRPLGGHLADRISGSRALLFLLCLIALIDAAFALLHPQLPSALLMLFLLYVGFGLGNGATFQWVAQRWSGRTGLMTGIIGCAEGIGGFYLPVLMGLAHESTGSYAAGFALFAQLAATAAALVARRRMVSRMDSDAMGTEERAVA